MASPGALSIRPLRRLRAVGALAVLWLALVLALGGWWVYHMYAQSRRIAELELANGASQSRVLAESATTHRMLVWESSTFLLVLLVLSVILFWFYWRDYLRARATQAFFAAFTHELRTPLTSMRLQAEALAEGDRSEELVRRLLADTHRLESQIDKTLELARLEGGGPLNEQAIPLQSWLPRTLASIAETHGERVRIATDVAADLPPILADAAALQMILRNLIENARRHSGVAPVHVHVRAGREGAGVRIALRDDGRGCTEPAAQLGSLFRRGAHSSGTGVGLYLVRRLMQRMGGHAEFCSPQEGGFEVRLSFSAGEP